MCGRACCTFIEEVVAVHDFVLFLEQRVSLMIGMSDLVRVSVRQVMRQSGFGVVFSIALGIMAFITLAVLGREIRYNIGQDMVLMGGVNVIDVAMEDSLYPGQPLREFRPLTVEALRTLPGVAAVSATLLGSKTFAFRDDEASVYALFLGVDSYYWETFAATLIAGRFFTEQDMAERRRVCIIGWELATTLFDSPEHALGERLFLESDVFEIVGVVGGVMIGSGIRGGYLPYTTVLDRQWMGGKVNRLYVRGIGWEDVPPLMERIPSVVREHQEAPYLMLRARTEQLERIQSTFVFVEALLWLGIVASLLLGGFGIWYGTFAAVRARTREVGLKKAMGGADKDILAQFLMEALCKSVAGGVLGIAFGSACVQIGASLLDSSMSYPLLFMSSCGSIVFSAVIGVAGGLYPALQASRMDVVTALRFE